MKIRCRQHLRQETPLMSCLAYRSRKVHVRNTYSNTYKRYKPSGKGLSFKWHYPRYKALIITVPLLFPKAYASEHKAISTAYANELEVRRDENWFQAEIRKFRTYPHLDRAYRLISEGRQQEAKKELKQFLSVDPKNVNVRMMYVTLLYRLKEYPEVIQQSNSVLQEQPGHTSAQLYRGLSRQWLGQLNKARVDFQSVMTNANATAQDRNIAIGAAANLALSQKNPLEALALLERFPAHKQDFHFHLQRGIILEELKRFSDAEVAYYAASQSTSVLKQRVKALTAYGHVAQKRGDWKEARKSFTEALALKPNNPQLMRLLADVSYHTKDYTEAVSWMQKLLAHMPNPQDREFLASILITQKQYRKAIAEYITLLDEGKTDALRYRTYMNLGYAYSNLKQYSQAVDAFRNAAKLQRNDLTLFALAEALDKNGQTKESIQTLLSMPKDTAASENKLEHTHLSDETKALTLAPHLGNLAEYYFRLAALYEKQGDKMAALAHLNQATRNKLKPAQRKMAYLP